MYIYLPLAKQVKARRSYRQRPQPLIGTTKTETETHIESEMQILYSITWSFDRIFRISNLLFLMKKTRINSDVTIILHKKVLTFSASLTSCLVVV